MTARAQPALQEALRRLALRPTPDCWLGFVRRALDAGSHEDARGDIAHTPAHYLVAVWAPATAGLVRWPEAVGLASPDPDSALLELVRHLPAGARVHLVPAEQVDSVLLARIILAADRNLEPYQRAGLEAFAERERAVEAARLAGYTDREGPFVALLDRLAPPPE